MQELENKGMTSKVYFSYTPQDFKVTYTQDTRHPGIVNHKLTNFGSRATIAVRIFEGKILYGISICDEVDTFDKTEGRIRAEERMNKAFGVVPLASFGKRNDNKQMIFGERFILDFLNNLTSSVYQNMSKYKNKIANFEKATNPAKKGDVKYKIRLGDETNNH